ncbi:hypothetical protein GCM10020000_80940 [Streptomyces olivoverticillatus]
MTQQFQNLLAGPGVQRAGRFVRDHRIRAGDQRAGDRDPLLLTAGELARPPLEVLAEPDRGE